jgi:sec-independent protein translocase protein TatA
VNALEPWHLLIIAGIFLLLFGAKRLPDSARSIGRSMRIFRSEMSDHDNAAAPSPVAAPAPVAPSPVVTPSPQAAPSLAMPTVATTDAAPVGR